MAGHVGRLEEFRSAFKILTRKTTGKILKKYVSMRTIVLFGS